MRDVDPKKASNYITKRAGKPKTLQGWDESEHTTTQNKTQSNIQIQHICDQLHVRVRQIGRINNMNMYHLLRKAKNGLCSDILLREPQECTPAEIRNSVVEAGRSQIDFSHW